MLQLYYHPSPNPLKIALYLEETGLPYELVPIDTRKGEQHSPAFRAINPNAKTPALVDSGVKVFVRRPAQPPVEQRTAAYWANQYYIPQFANLVRGFRGVQE